MKWADKSWFCFALQQRAERSLLIAKLFSGLRNAQQPQGFKVKALPGGSALLHPVFSCSPSEQRGTTGISWTAIACNQTQTCLTYLGNRLIPEVYLISLSCSLIISITQLHSVTADFSPAGSPSGFTATVRPRHCRKLN